MPVTGSYGTRRGRSKDGWQQVAGPVVWAVSDKERLPSARQERFVVRQAAAPPTTASEAMAGTRALPHGTRQRLGAASARPLSLPASVDWAVRAVGCRCVGRAVCAAGLGPWAPGECRHALRAQQPAQAVCERAGHRAASCWDWLGPGHSLCFKARLPQRSVSEPCSTARLSGCSDTSQSEGPGSGAELCCRRHGWAILAQPAVLTAASQRRYLGRMLVPDFQSNTGDKQLPFVFLITQLLSLCPSFGQAPPAVRGAPRLLVAISAVIHLSFHLCAFSLLLFSLRTCNPAPSVTAFL